MNSIRAERVASLIKEEISDIISKILEHESVGFWTVTNVRMSPDLRYAKIYISIYGDKVIQQNTIRKIESFKKNIRQRLGSRLRLRFVPEIEFYLDDTLEHVDRINALLKQIENREKNNRRIPFEISKNTFTEFELFKIEGRYGGGFGLRKRFSNTLTIPPFHNLTLKVQLFKSINNNYVDPIYKWGDGCNERYFKGCLFE